MSVRSSSSVANAWLFVVVLASNTERFLVLRLVVDDMHALTLVGQPGDDLVSTNFIGVLVLVIEKTDVIWFIRLSL
jgi:hypothetical protein